MDISLEPAHGSSFPAWDGFPLLPTACPSARVQVAAHSTQTTLCALMDPGKGCSRGAPTAGDLPTQPGLSRKLVDVRVAGD